MCKQPVGWFNLRMQQILSAEIYCFLSKQYDSIHNVYYFSSVWAPIHKLHIACQGVPFQHICIMSYDCTCLLTFVYEIEHEHENLNLQSHLSLYSCQINTYVLDQRWLLESEL